MSSKARGLIQPREKASISSIYAFEFEPLSRVDSVKKPLGEVVWSSTYQCCEIVYVSYGHRNLGTINTLDQ